jgi:hypothetical protein
MWQCMTLQKTELVMRDIVQRVVWANQCEFVLKTGLVGIIMVEI